MATYSEILKWLQHESYYSQDAFLVVDRITYMILELSDEEYDKLVQELPNLKDYYLFCIIWACSQYELEHIQKYIESDRIKLFGKAAKYISLEEYDVIYDEMYELVIERKIMKSEPIKYEYKGKTYETIFIPILFTDEDKVAFIQKRKELIDYRKSN